MTVDELRQHGNKPVSFRGGTYILVGMRTVSDINGKRVQVKLQDTRVKHSFVIARAQEVREVE